VLSYALRVRTSGRTEAIVPAMAACVVATVVAACGSGSSANPRSPRTYLEHTLDLIEQQAIYAPALDWNAVVARARKLAAGAKSPRGTYPAIRYVIRQLHDAGDEHALFFEPALAKRHTPGAPALEARSPPPSVSILDGRLGLVRMPGIASTPGSPNSQRYAAAALTAIRRLSATRRPCGWIVDLRNDPGGDMFPMLLSIGPILGEGRLIGFSGKRGLRHFVSYRGGVLSGDGFTYRAPLVVPDLRPLPPVAVLIGEETASSGEAVAVAFHGRAQTRSFGWPTWGATTAAQWNRLADGAELVVGGPYFVARDGTVYRHGVKPDADVNLLGPGDPYVRAAAGWLLRRPACA
jgi:carboxyl-terminal processing protease